MAKRVFSLTSLSTFNASEMGLGFEGLRKLELQRRPQPFTSSLLAKRLQKPVLGDSHAQQPDGAPPLVPPSSATFRQLQHVDEAQAEIAAAQDQLQTQQGGSDQRNFVRVMGRLNGGIVSLDLDMADLRRAMGLPSYDLFPAFRPTLDESSPAENIEDEDHADGM
ncbi:hypothetical protein PHYSODRAFT_293481 [Phytophthora sojae]|uniref:Uncharacterized protein n=1 Tax=Phytophthora sojae (strain P6497) TaxID=1094619 RepID=G4YIE2_PHYSP|nr:hypothetical protein PHYSODRAFT_293481 [Phytophthora sojae]EGZ27745.1 hypothetical protein PHYSODRAFT_293481 [Phytophthora sojae]|eukprot:XP_009515020.1 hypothetical protein PHYSODRAFT_293481 [Phytophthora sojae]